MKNSKSLLFLLSLIVLTGTILFSGCSKDKGENPEPGVSKGIASATVEFLDTNEKVQFTGTTMGGISSGKRDTVMMTFAGQNNAMQFILVITPVSKGTHTMRKDGFETHGLLYQDSTKGNILNAYLVGEDNIDENELKMDGEASFTVSSFSNKNIKGTFELSMIRNTTIKEDGEIISGGIRKVKVTNGKFDVPLFNKSNLLAR